MGGVDQFPPWGHRKAAAGGNRVLSKIPFLEVVSSAEWISSASSLTQLKDK